MLYRIFSQLFQLLLPCIGMLSPKLRLFVAGRKNVFQQLEMAQLAGQQVIWFHCASLGEYEQGVPIMKQLRQQYPTTKLVVSFFSPSGFEAKKNSELATAVVYLPIDTIRNAQKFIALLNPTLAIFVKYEFWPHYFKVLHKQSIPILMVASVFRADQAFFKWYGGMMRTALRQVTHFFVQDAASKTLLAQNGFDNVTISGDTRFDRVTAQLEVDNTVDFIADFIGERKCVVIGSSWPEDEAVFVGAINDTAQDVCYVIAPHEVTVAKVQRLVDKLTVKTVRFSDQSHKELSSYQVFVLDTVGYLSRVYHYATIAYVGGAMGTTGLHNVLEPATFGIPIIIGQYFEKFREAQELEAEGALFSIKNAAGFETILQKLLADESYRKQVGAIASRFIADRTGATRLITDYIDDQQLLGEKTNV